jgi:hypothetical protein
LVFEFRMPIDSPTDTGHTQPSAGRYNSNRIFFSTAGSIVITSRGPSFGWLVVGFGVIRHFLINPAESRAAGTMASLP